MKKYAKFQKETRTTPAKRSQAKSKRMVLLKRKVRSCGLIPAKTKKGLLRQTKRIDTLKRRSK